MGNAADTAPPGMDALQSGIIALAGRRIAAGDLEAVGQRRTEILTLIHRADSSALALLDQRLSRVGDRLGKYLEARLSTGLMRRIRGDLAQGVLATRGVSTRLSTPGRSITPDPGRQGTRDARRFLALLDTPSPGGRRALQEGLRRYLAALPLVDASRLVQRLERADDPLRTRLIARLGPALAERLLSETAPSLSEGWLPEELDGDTLIRGVSGARVVIGGADDEALTAQYRQALFDEAARRGVAESKASDQRLSDMALAKRFPALPLDQLHAIQKVANRDKSWVDAHGKVAQKVAISKFLSSLNRLSEIAPGPDRLHAYGIWAAMMKVDNPNAENRDYFGSLTEDMGDVGQIFEDVFRDKLHKLNYRWIYAISTPSFMEFVGELYDTGELFELKNFKGAAIGMGDGLFMAAKGVADTIDPRTWVQVYKDLREHGSYIFKAFRKDSIDAVKADLGRKFDAFARLSSEQQARATSAVLTAAVASPLVEAKVAQAGVNIVKVAAPAVKTAVVKLKDADMKEGLPKARLGKKKKPIRTRWVQGKFRQEMRKIIDEDHELSFLLNESATGWYKSPSNKHRDLYQADLAKIRRAPFDAGHIKSDKILNKKEIPRVMIQDRWHNRGTHSTVVEIPGIPAGFWERPCIEIGVPPVPVDAVSAVFWATYPKGNPLLSLERVLKAPAHPGWNNGL